MKKLFLLTLFAALLLAGCLIPLGPGNGAKERLEDFMAEKGIVGNVTTTDNLILITFEANGSDADMIETMNLLMNKTRYMDSRDVRIEAFRGGKPYWAMTYDGQDMYYEDIRSPEWRIMDEMSVFDFYGSIWMSGPEIVFKGEYVGNESDFLNQLFSAALIGFEYAPWTERFTFLVGPLDITVPKTALLDYLDGKLSQEELEEQLTVRKNDYWKEPTINESILLVDNESMLTDKEESCNNTDYAYKQYVKYYNIVTDLMSKRNAGEEVNKSYLNESYKQYEYWRKCYLDNKPEEPTSTEEEEEHFH